MAKASNVTSPEQAVELLVSAIVHYVEVHQQLFGKYEGDLMQRPSGETLLRISGTFQQFLVREKLDILLPLFDIIHTSQGYGYADEVAALYGLMWNTPTLMVTSALTALGIDKPPFSLYIMKEGFEKIWNVVVEKEDLNIRYNADIFNLNRHYFGSDLHYAIGTDRFTEYCGFTIWAAPMAELLKVTNGLSGQEMHLFGSLEPDIFTASLMKARGTIRNQPYTIFAQNLEKKVDHSVIEDIDIKGTFSKNLTEYDQKTNGSRITYVLQLGKQLLNEAKLNNLAHHHYANGFNSTDIEIFNPISWLYFYRWAPNNAEHGYHWRVFDMQGMHRMWYTGASVCFESVKSVMEYNNLLLRQMVQ